MVANSNKTPNMMIDYSQAMAIIEDVASNHRSQLNTTRPLLEALHEILAEEVCSPINVPGFDNSAMDGFALDSTSVNAEVEKNGSVEIVISGSIQAGDAADAGGVEANTAWEIMTGAPVPKQFDAVIQIEKVEIVQSNGKKRIIVSEIVKKGRNIRKCGTDYAVNEIVVDKHKEIAPQHIMALATVGVKSVAVLEKVKVAILSTGNELAKKSTTSLNSGKIYNSNQPFLKSMVKKLACETVLVGRCKDDSEEFDVLLSKAIANKAKIIFSTGAVSMGKYDFIPKALLARGAKIYFHKVKIRPGKPLLFAELPGGIIYFGLPGNPIAAAAGLRFFVSPFIRHMLGLAREKRLKARMLTTLSKKQGFRTFAKAIAFVDEQGQLKVDMLMDQGSYQSCSFAQSNCWLILPEHATTIKAGQLVEIAPMVPNQMVF